jgi:hypothetical protein
LADDLLQPRQGPGRPPKLTDAELICLAVAQVLLDCPGDRKFLAMASYRLHHLFPYLPKQPGYNKRVRALAGEICCLINLIAFESPSFCDRVWLLDTTPVPCGASRASARRSELAGIASYGYCRSQHRYFWGMKLVLVCAPDGMPVGFELVPANTPERPAAAEVLERIPLQGRILVADKGFVGREFGAFVEALGARLVRPTAKTSRAAATARSALSASGSSRSSTRSRDSSRSSATARARCAVYRPGSRSGCSHWLPRFATTSSQAAGTAA